LGEKVGEKEGEGLEERVEERDEERPKPWRGPPPGSKYPVETCRCRASFTRGGSLTCGSLNFAGQTPLGPTPPGLSLPTFIPSLSP